MSRILDPNETPGYKGQHFYPGYVSWQGTVLFVGRPKWTDYVADNGIYSRQVVQLAFRCHDGVVRRAKFCQSMRDRFTPGQTPDYVGAPLSDPRGWPASANPPADTAEKPEGTP